MHCILFAYTNVPHDSTGEKPSYLLFGTDCRTPTDTALKPSSLQPGDVQDYRQKLSLALFSKGHCSEDYTESSAALQVFI